MEVVVAEVATTEVAVVVTEVAVVATTVDNHHRSQQCMCSICR